MASELDRIMGADRLARPHAVAGRRDPAPEWDTWYEEFTSTDRRRLVAFTVADGGVAPDVLATWLGTSVDDAMWQWRQAALAELKSLQHDYLAQDRDQEEAALLAAADAALLGPQELAAACGVSPAVIHQWRRRERLPQADLVISGVPMWYWRTIAHVVEARERIAS